MIDKKSSITLQTFLEKGRYINDLSVCDYIVNEQRLSEFVKNNDIESAEIIYNIENYFCKYVHKSLQTIPITEEISLKRFDELYKLIMDVSQDFQLNDETEEDPEEDFYDGLTPSLYFRGRFEDNYKAFSLLKSRWYAGRNLCIEKRITLFSTNISNFIIDHFVNKMGERVKKATNVCVMFSIIDRKAHFEMLRAYSDKDLFDYYLNFERIKLFPDTLDYINPNNPYLVYEKTFAQYHKTLFNNIENVIKHLSEIYKKKFTFFVLPDIRQ